jgi:transposase-like protein
VTERAAPFYCPYCGDEDLRPSEQGHGAWECAACNRAFKLSFLGLLARGLPRGGSKDGQDSQHDQHGREGNHTP